MREIGSEFWTPYESASAPPSGSEAYLLSGRTALRFLIDDIRATRSARKALLPSYCCESMIMPFVQAGIDVQFYPADSRDAAYPFGHDADVVLLIDFFGYVHPQNREIARREKQAGKMIIYDATHKLDGNPEVQKHADYSFCSCRKWFYCNYAQAVKHNGVFGSAGELTFNPPYIALRDDAAREKAAYIAGLTHEKESFLAKFRAAEQMLDEDYAGYAGVPVAVDLREIVSRRRENAAYLIGELRNIPRLRLWRENLGQDDTPMFVPILVDPRIRDDLRGALVKQNIYCPVHWPRSPYHGPADEIYDRELSLVCDQRYDTSDMERMISVIKAFLGR